MLATSRLKKRLISIGIDSTLFSLLFRAPISREINNKFTCTFVCSYNKMYPSVRFCASFLYNSARSSLKQQNVLCYICESDIITLKALRVKSFKAKLSIDLTVSLQSSRILEIVRNNLRRVEAANVVN
jgi:hypothetical protein